MKKKPAKKQTTKTPRTGRPPLAKRKDYDPPRQLGRVSDGDWEELRDAASASGLSFTDWAVSNLLILARGGKTIPHTK